MRKPHTYMLHLNHATSSSTPVPILYAGGDGITGTATNISGIPERIVSTVIQSGVNLIEIISNINI